MIHSPMIFVGFDSAWADNPKAAGAICSIRFDGERFFDFHPPKLVGFERALDHIDALGRSDAPILIALDQPTIVPNETGMRPVEKVVASIISWMGGGVQPANRGKVQMFGPHAPVWAFLERLGAAENPEAVRTAEGGLHLIEVFPALALASFEAAFFDRLKGPRYSPGRRRTFRHEDWLAVIASAQHEGSRFGCYPLVWWLDEARSLSAPKKADQDRLDAGLCLLNAIRWRIAPRFESVVIGDLTTGYMVAPASEQVRRRLVDLAKARGVGVN